MLFSNYLDGANVISRTIYNRASWSVVAAACMLAACGGGGSDTTPAARVTSVKVMGDSLADSGTFGYKFTVQGSAATGTGSGVEGAVLRSDLHCSQKIAPSSLSKPQNGHFTMAREPSRVAVGNTLH